jgi:translation initiation factor 1
MAKKSKKIKLGGDGMVYSTNPQFSYEDDQDENTLPPNEQCLDVHVEVKGRGGKPVVIIRGFVGSEADLETLGRMLRQKCGVGGSSKDGEILVQGNVRDKVMALLKAEGYQVKRVGG